MLQLLGQVIYWGQNLNVQLWWIHSDSANLRKSEDNLYFVTVTSLLWQMTLKVRTVFEEEERNIWHTGITFRFYSLIIGSCKVCRICKWRWNSLKIKGGKNVEQISINAKAKSWLAFGADTTDALSPSETFHYKADFLQEWQYTSVSGELEIVLLPGSTAFGSMMHAFRSKTTMSHNLFGE